MASRTSLSQTKSTIATSGSLRLGGPPGAAPEPATVQGAVAAPHSASYRDGPSSSLPGGQEAVHDFGRRGVRRTWPAGIWKASSGRRTA